MAVSKVCENSVTFDTHFFPFFLEVTLNSSVIRRGNHIIQGLSTTNAGPTALDHCLVLLGKALSCPFAGLDELINAPADAGLLL
jgi:hypothetical protein